MRVLHIITDLDVGGAEIMLHRFLLATRLGDCAQEVVSLRELGAVGRRVRELGFRVHAIGMRRGRPSPREVLRLALLIREIRPDVIQTWMYHADLLGGLAARLAGRARIVWGIHNSTLDPQTTRWSTRATVAACARLSHRLPDRIVSVSRAARDLHVAAGYAPEKFVVIPNGFDLREFQPDPASRRAVRDELRIPDEVVLIGLVARVAPQKDHVTFARAAGLLGRRAPRVRFLLCGEGATPANDELGRAIAATGLQDRFMLLGRRDDVPRVMAALDVGTLSSAYGEAFPLVIGEAMACGVPCVVTDLGDCAFLVGDTGRVVPPRDPEALARAWGDLVGLGPEARGRLGVAARARIEARFSLPRVAADYVELYRRVLADSGVRGTAGAEAQ